MLSKSKNVFTLFVIAILLNTLPTTSAHAQRDRVSRGSGAATLCSDEEPKVVVKLATSKTRYYKNHSAQTINSIHNSGGAGTILGLAGGPIEITTRGQFAIRTLKGKACVQIKNIEVLFWAKPVIVIASNFPKGSCEYNAVFAHEQDHVRKTRRFLREYAPELRREAREIIETSRQRLVVTENRIEDAQKKLQEPIISRLALFQNKIMPILQSRQAEIDSPEEYKKVSDKCDNWGKRLIGYN